MKTKIVNGYVLVKTTHPNAKNGYIQQHRLVVEEKISRYLTPEEKIHHIDFNKQNNSIKNLMLFKNQKEHMKFHLKIKQFGFTNPVKTQIKNRWENE